jgi:hypothetical protein
MLHFQCSSCTFPKLITEINDSVLSHIFIKMLSHRKKIVSIMEQIKELQWKVIYHWNRRIFTCIMVSLYMYTQIYKVKAKTKKAKSFKVMGAAISHLTVKILHGRPPCNLIRPMC